MSMKIVTEQTSPEESPTRYMLPEQVQQEESGLISYKYGDLSPAKYPIDPTKKDEGEGSGYSNTDSSLNQYSPASYRFSKKKKRKSSAQNKESKKKKKPKTGKTVQFHSKVIIKTICGKRKSDLTEIELSNEEEYDKRNSEFVVKRAHQKQWMKLHHQQRPMTPKRLKIQATIQRANGNA